MGRSYKTKNPAEAGFFVVAASRSYLSLKVIRPLVRS